MKAESSEWSRRDFLRVGAAAGAGASLAGSPVGVQSASDRDDDGPDDFNEATICAAAGGDVKRATSAVELTRFYLRRIQAIDERGPHLNSVIELNPDAIAMAEMADADRRRGRLHGPLHGIPVLLKDNIDTGDRTQTTAGSFALAGQPAVRDSTVAAKLRAGGAVILGKANLSEWANFRSSDSSSGWSGRGGQCNNPYAIDRNPCGSSSGSGAAVSANLCTVALATETDGSIVCPAHNNGVVGIKPTVGVTSRAGVVPISHTQDTIGPHARTVADAAAVLTVIASQRPDARDPATAGVPLGSAGLRDATVAAAGLHGVREPDGLEGARIGVTRQGVDAVDDVVGGVFDDALAAMRKPVRRWSTSTRRGSSFRRRTANSSSCCSTSLTICATTSPPASVCRWPAGRSTISSPSTTRTPRSRCRSSARISSSWPRRSRPARTLLSPSSAA